MVRQFSVNDFLSWREHNELELVPWFQRREVWYPKARSYLIDTILKNLPIPIIIIRESISPKTGRTCREVVDGQQRLKAVFDFYDDKLTINSAHSEVLAGKSFRDLPGPLKERFRSYEFPVNVLKNASDAEVLDIFARINSYTITLNRQEILNAKYHGEFKSFIYRLSGQYLNFFQSNGILSERAVFRMAEAELISELVIAMIDGFQDKAKIENYYRVNEETFPLKEEVELRFKETCALIDSIFSFNLPKNFKGKALFYSLFLVLYDLEHVMIGQNGEVVHLSSNHYSNIREAVERLDRVIEDKEPSEITFLRACAQSTDKKTSRQIRHERIKVEILGLIRRS